MILRLACLLLLAAVGPLAHATPHVWFDTDRGSFLVELDPVKAPLTTAHFLTLVDEKHYDGLMFHRSVANFVIQAGRFDGSGALRPRLGTVMSERNNGLSSLTGTISLALPQGAGGAYLHNNGSTDFFINLANNTSLDPDFTVFGRIVFGLPVAQAIGAGATYSGEVPLRPALIRRAVKSDGFPIMNLHTGAWYDPAKSGRGFSVEVAHVPGNESGGPILVIYWYDYVDGRQLWLTGIAPFAYGASEVTVPLALTDGGQFGDDYDPTEVTVDPDFGTLTVRFTGCDAGTFSYQTAFGDGTMALRRLTIPGGERCQ
jgi:peptidyl-prolyl cis-trans isomerase A (cyclophilin A)